MPKILSCDITALKHYNNESNGRVSRDQINNKICSSYMKNDDISFYAQECGVKPEDSILISSDEQFECEFDPDKVIKTFKTQPCNPIRWSPKDLVQKLCSIVGNNTYSSQTELEDIKATMEIIKQENTENLGNLPLVNSTNPTLDLATDNSISGKINTPGISFNPTTESLTTTTLADTTLGSGIGGAILAIVGGSAITIGAIGGIIWYTCSKSSKSTSTNFQEEELKFSTRSKEDIESYPRLLKPECNMRENFEEAGVRLSTFNSQKDKEKTSLLDNPHTRINEVTHTREIIHVYEVISTKAETSNLPEAVQKVSDRPNNLLDDLNHEREEQNQLLNIANNESNDVQSRNAHQEMDNSLNNLLDDLTNMVTSPSNDHIVLSNESDLLGIDTTVNEVVN